MTTEMYIAWTLLGPVLFYEHDLGYWWSQEVEIDLIVERKLVRKLPI